MRLAAVVLSGCSFIAVRGPGDHEHAPVTCTASRTLPELDTSASIMLGVAFAVIFGIADAMNRNPTTPPALAAAGGFVFGAGAVGLPFWTSATYGYYEVSRCRDVQGTPR